MSNILAQIFTILLIVLLLIAGWTDIRSRTIPNEVNLAIALLAIGWWFVCGLSFWPGIGIRIAVAIVVFVIFALMFALRMMGGGDVKMIAALALWLPFASLMTMLTVMALSGGIITLFLLARHRWRPNENRPQVPYGIAIAIGGLWVSGNGLLTITAS
jgi:prepilin peptidase CpaA